MNTEAIHNTALRNIYFRFIDVTEGGVVNTEAIHNTALRNIYKAEIDAAIAAVNRGLGIEAS